VHAPAGVYLLAAALCALAAVGLDIVIEKFFAIIVGKLLTGFDISLCVDEYFLFVLVHLRFAVGAAGVVDVAGKVLAPLTIDHVIVVYGKEVLTATAVSLIGRDLLTGVFDHERIFRNILGGKEAKTCSGALNSVGVRILSFRHSESEYIKGLLATRAGRGDRCPSCRTQVLRLWRIRVRSSADR